MSKKRVLIVSDSISISTGYGRVSSSIIHNLKDKYDIAQLGIAAAAISEDSKLPIHCYTQFKNHSECCGRGLVIEYKEKDTGKFSYIVPNLKLELHKNQTYCNKGKPAQEDLFAQDSSFYVIQHFKPDVVIPINDMWGLYHFNYLINRKNFTFLPYLAVDSECFPAMIEPQRPHMPEIDTIKFIGGSNSVVVFTDWAKNTINKTVQIVTQGMIAQNISVIPHGVDNTIFRPLDNKVELREKYFHIKPEDNTFLVGSVSRNQPRKALDLIMKTIRIFIDKYEKPHRKIRCHFHCAMKDRMGWDLTWIAKYYGVLDRCIFDNKLKPGFGVPEPILNEIMSCYDSHLIFANSEGFCLPIIESMSCGVPNLISDYSAHGDWTKDAALKVKIAAQYHEVRTNHIKAIIDVEHAAKQLNLLYNSDKMCREYSRKSIALANSLQWSNICKLWEKLIDSFNPEYPENRYDLLTIKQENLPILPSNPIEENFNLMEI